MTERRERDLPTGDLAVSSHWCHGTRGAVTVPADDRPLYDLLTDVLADTRTPDLAEARLARTCDNLVDVHEAVTTIERGQCAVDGIYIGMNFCHRIRDAIADYRDREPLQLVAVGCSGSKHDDSDPLPAKDRYKGSYWTNKRRYGETCADDWRIISAEHAVLAPETPLDHYDTHITDLCGIPVDDDARLPTGDAVETMLDCWALDVYEGLSAWLSATVDAVDPRDVQLTVLLGTDYRDPLAERGVFERLRAPGTVSVSFPFQECEAAQGGLFDQIEWLADEVAAAGAAAEVADD